MVLASCWLLDRYETRLVQDSKGVRRPSVKHVNIDFQDAHWLVGGREAGLRPLRSGFQSTSLTTDDRELVKRTIHASETRNYINITLSCIKRRCSRTM